MKQALLLLLLPAAGLFASDSWPPVPFTTVRAYAWPGNLGNPAGILPGMKLAPRCINKEGTLLTADQVHRLQVAASHRQRKVDIFQCYNPHNAFVFYNAANKPVAYLELCFSCLGNRAQPPIPPSNVPNYLSLAAIFEELKLPMGPYTTAKAFRKAHQDE
jgi:hypothetical protein